MSNPAAGDDELRQNPNATERAVDKEQEEVLEPAADPDSEDGLGDGPADER